MEQYGLLAPLHDLVECIEQGLRENRSAAGGELAPQVGHDNLGKARRTGALGHLDPGPAGTPVATGLTACERLGRRRGGSQHQGAPMELRQLGSHLARVVARATSLFVALLMLLVDDDEAEIGKRTEERRARAHHHAGRTRTNHIPLVEALARGKARMEHRHRVTETRAEATNSLRRERDLGHEHTGRATMCQNALDGGQIHLGLTRTGHAVDQDHVTGRGLGRPCNRGEGVLLPSRELFGRGCVCGGKRGGALASAPTAALLHRHHAALLERANRGGQVAVHEIEFARGDRSAGKRIDELALAHRALGGLERAALLGETHPTHGNGRDGRRFIRIRAVFQPHDLAGTARGQQQAQALGKRCHIFAAHPKRELGRGGRERRGGNDLANRLDAGRLETFRARELSQRLGARDNVPRLDAPTKRNENRGAHLADPIKSEGHPIRKGLGQRPRRNVDHHGDIA